MDSEQTIEMGLTLFSEQLAAGPSTSSGRTGEVLRANGDEFSGRTVEVLWANGDGLALARQAVDSQSMMYKVTYKI